MRVAVQAVADVSAEHVQIRDRHTLTELIAAATEDSNVSLANRKKKMSLYEKQLSEAVQQEQAEAVAESAAAAAAAAGVDDAGARTFVWEISLDRGISFEMACDRLRDITPDQQSAYTGFWVSEHPITRAAMPLLAILRPTSAYFQIYRQLPQQTARNGLGKCR